MEMPIYLPNFLLEWKSFIKKLSKLNKYDKSLFIEQFLRSILIFTLVLLLLIFVLYNL